MTEMKSGLNIVSVKQNYLVNKNDNNGMLLSANTVNKHNIL